MIEHTTVPTQSALRMPSWLAAFGMWYAAGVRGAVFMTPRWHGLHATPVVLAALVLIGALIDVGMDRLYIDGPAVFYWQAIASGWLYTVLIAWACYLVRPVPNNGSAIGSAPSAMHLFCLSLAQTHILSLVTGMAFVGLERIGVYQPEELNVWTAWAAWLTPLIWVVLAQWTLLIRGGDRKLVATAVAVLTVAGAVALYFAVPGAQYWYAAQTEENEAEPKYLQLTQEMMERQPPLLAQRLQEVQPQRAGIVDLYAIGFAPYAHEDVFRRESDMVTSVMAQRFDATGRTLQLVNHVDTAEQWPWATPLNLQRAIQHIASVMDREEDVLFLHLTSHGARDGELAAAFWPLNVASVTPAQLKTWLDEAGIRHRVISISACYSGSWLAPLAGEDTLVVTAADADHTSYGCGRLSELTFFGRAMYDEQLRNSTLSFEDAHAAARTVIKEREEEAGKDDGYSNPQISVGSAIRERLARLRERLAQNASR